MMSYKDLVADLNSNANAKRDLANYYKHMTKVTASFASDPCVQNLDTVKRVYDKSIDKVTGAKLDFSCLMASNVYASHVASLYLAKSKKLN